MRTRPLFAAVFALALLAGCAESQTHESTGQYFDDASITAKVKTQLLTAKDVSATDISVQTVGGVVDLSGFAKSEQERRHAGEIAAAVPGVSQVHNDIRIR